MKERAEKLIAKYLLGIITDSEEEQLKRWGQSSPHREEFFNRLRSDLSFRKQYESYIQIDSNHAWKQFKQKYHKRYTISITTVIKYAAILILPVLLIGGGWHYYSTSTKEQISDNLETGDVIQPGVVKATLILAKNQKQALTSTIPTQVKVGQTATAIAQNGMLIYQASVANEKVKELENNILTTNQGNEFRVTFEDGTTVHLNYNTKLQYPIKFSSTRRVVYLKGEAYFKIAKDARPFYVVTEAGTVKQYGTEFNVNTFTPYRTEVVLVEGSISIISSGSKKEQHITQGQLAYVDRRNDSIALYNVDTTPYVAWNEGRLIFENRSLESIMEILEHWYKVKVSFGSPELKHLHFTGNMDRYGTISPILKAIARTTNLNIRIEGRDILITEN